MNDIRFVRANNQIRSFVAQLDAPTMTSCTHLRLSAPASDEWEYPNNATEILGLRTYSKRRSYTTSNHQYRPYL